MDPRRYYLLPKFVHYDIDRNIIINKYINKLCN